MKETIFDRAKIKKWRRLKDKIELVLVLVAIISLYTYGREPFGEAVIICAVSVYGLIKALFVRQKRFFLLLLLTMMLFQGLRALLKAL